MISFLEGEIAYTGDKFVILNTGAIGYRVIVVPKVLDILSKNKAKVKLFVHSQMNIREGTFDLYGFDKPEDLEVFNLLTSVNGIGPKAAMNILSTIEPKYLKAAVIHEDATYLKKVSGLGPKTAQRLILELKNKVDYIDVDGQDAINLTQEGDAVDALVSLGYSLTQAKEALKEVTADTLQDRVKLALKVLGKK